MSVSSSAEVVVSVMVTEEEEEVANIATAEDDRHAAAFPVLLLFRLTSSTDDDGDSVASFSDWADLLRVREAIPPLLPCSIDRAIVLVFGWSSRLRGANF